MIQDAGFEKSVDIDHSKRTPKQIYLGTDNKRTDIAAPGNMSDRVPVKAWLRNVFLFSTYGYENTGSKKLFAFASDLIDPIWKSLSYRQLSYQNFFKQCQHSEDDKKQSARRFPLAKLTYFNHVCISKRAFRPSSN
jgi:hypothetical protein